MVMYSIRLGPWIEDHFSSYLRMKEIVESFRYCLSYSVINFYNVFIGVECSVLTENMLIHNIKGIDHPKLKILS